jgi:hypothetical protein
MAWTDNLGVGESGLAHGSTLTRPPVSDTVTALLMKITFADLFDTGKTDKESS